MSTKKPAIGKCCPVLDLVLTRDTHGNMKPTGFAIGSLFHLSGKKTRSALIYYFNKAKKTDLSEHGFKSEYAGTTYATVDHCPFCGAGLK